MKDDGVFWEIERRLKITLWRRRGLWEEKRGRSGVGVLYGVGGEEVV